MVVAGAPLLQLQHDVGRRVVTIDGDLLEALEVAQAWMEGLQPGEQLRAAAGQRTKGHDDARAHGLVLPVAR
jgi:hypothetical protein